MLDKTSIAILEYIKNNAPADTKDIDSLVSNLQTTEKHLYALKAHNFIIGKTLKSLTTDNGIKYLSFSPYEITPDGLAYLENDKDQKRKEKFDNFHKWVNTIIAALALLSAIPALILSIMQLLK